MPRTKLGCVITVGLAAGKNGELWGPSHMTLLGYRIRSPLALQVNFPRKSILAE